MGVGLGSTQTQRANPPKATSAWAISQEHHKNTAACPRCYGYCYCYCNWNGWADAPTFLHCYFASATTDASTLLLLLRLLLLLLEWLGRCTNSSAATTATSPKPPSAKAIAGVEWLGRCINAAFTVTIAAATTGIGWADAPTLLLLLLHLRNLLLLQLEWLVHRICQLSPAGPAGSKGDAPVRPLVLGGPSLLVLSLLLPASPHRLNLCDFHFDWHTPENRCRTHL